MNTLLMKQAVRQAVKQGGRTRAARWAALRVRALVPALVPVLVPALVPVLAALCAGPAQAALRVLACEPEWGALVKELAGPAAELTVATTALQDPHHIEARPSLLAAARRADLLVCTGAELEAGWLPVLLRQCGNGAIQAGRPGHFAAADFVPRLEVPARVDRADGDVHAGGNPHIQTDPRNIARVADALAARLIEVDPGNAAAYRQRQADFAGRWRAALQRWERQGATLRGAPVVVQHRGFPYLENWLGLVQVAALEPKPGVEPSTAHLATVLASLQARPARMILRAAYNDGRGADWLAGRTGLPVVTLPYTVGGTPQAADLFGLFDDTLARLLAAAGQGGAQGRSPPDQGKPDRVRGPAE